MPVAAGLAAPMGSTTRTLREECIPALSVASTMVGLLEPTRSEDPRASAAYTAEEDSMAVVEEATAEEAGDSSQEEIKP